MKNTCEWKKVNIKEYEDCYLVSNTGEVYSLHRNKTLKPKMTREGYLKVTLCNGHGKQKVCGIHRLVALTFIPNPKKTGMCNRKRCAVFDKRGNLLGIFSTQKEAGAKYNVHTSKVSACISGQIKSSKGFIFKRIEEDWGKIV